ncbi:MAG: hypothetical protein B6241_01055 [Spirochaetaceae bacterium 4572_59]|nr:MAG: hypothetical protein B6241_01055 [Spirochaetaceae bacterium 4572_59]
MGYKYSGPALILLSLLLLASCGEFIGFDTLTPHMGDLSVLKIYLADDEVDILNDSMTVGGYASCSYKGDAYGGLDKGGGAQIRMRGYTSRFVPKKNFTLAIDQDDEDDAEKFAIDAGNPWASFNIVMRAYSLVGLPAPELFPVALYMNDEYLGYYNIISIYDEDVDDIYGEEGELYKIRFHDIGNGIPAEEDCEKKYPNDDDYSSLNLFLVYAEHLATEDWVPWIEENVDLESVASYMVVRDFLGISDTSMTNFYIYAGDKYRILPWDNDRLYEYGGIGGNNVITKRMFESKAFQGYYRDQFNKYFLELGEANIIKKLCDYKEELEVLLEPAAEIDVFYMDYDSYTYEMEYIDTFLNVRAANILSDSSWADFFNE